MRSAYLLLIPTLLLLLALPVSRGRYNDDFDDGEDLADFDDNDFAEFEDMTDDPAAETETAPPPRASQSSQPEEDEDEATVELEDGLDGFEDSETQVRLLEFLYSKRVQFSLITFSNLILSFPRIKIYTANMTRKSLRGLETWRRQATP